MRVALVHDCIFNKGGAERVLLNMHKAFPNAPIFTSIFDKTSTYPEFEDCNIKTTWLQRIAPNEKSYKRTFMIFFVMQAMQSHDLSDYDIILLSSTHNAKYVKAGKNSFVVNYCYTPFRLAWNPNSYSVYEKATGLKLFLFGKVINMLKKIDYYYAQRTNKFIAMTNETSDQIKNCYRVKNEIKIIKPSIDTSKFYVSEKIDDYYLVVSRLEKYKKVDLVIETFNKLGSKLKIVGRGMDESKLKRLANNNIEFLGGVSQKVLNELYSKCKALIFAHKCEYGLVPLESNASGRPVIAYGYGGVLNTMIKYNAAKQTSNFTALYFYQQNSDSLLKSIQLFENLTINSIFIRKHAENFDDQIFIKELKNFIEKEHIKFKGYSDQI